MASFIFPYGEYRRNLTVAILRELNCAEQVIYGKEFAKSL